MKHRALLLLQPIGALLALVFVPTNPARLAAVLLLGAVTFRRLTRREAVFFAAVCAFFTVMDAVTLQQGIFRFTEPNLLGLPVWEFFMWGFYLLHTLRLLDGPVPTGARWKSWLFAVAFIGAFSAIRDPDVLLAVTGALLVLGLAVFHQKLDFAYTFYMVALGAAVEYTGVWSGLWVYPGSPLGGVPPWFITLWGGVGLMLRRWMMPMVLGSPAAAPQAAVLAPGAAE